MTGKELEHELHRQRRAADERSAEHERRFDLERRAADERAAAIERRMHSEASRIRESPPSIMPPPPRHWPHRCRAPFNGPMDRPMSIMCIWFARREVRKSQRAFGPLR